MQLLPYAGRGYLERVTTFLSACRSRAPLAGMWDVADLHWWWRDDAYREPSKQLFWEEDDQTLGMLLLSDSFATFDYEVMPGYETSAGASALFAEGLVWLGRLEQSAAEPSFFVRDDHLAFQTLAHDAGFHASGATYVQTVQDLHGARWEAQVPEGFVVRPLKEADLVEGRPPVLRISAARFERVTQTPSYRRDFHLVVVSSRGDVAAECICWWDEANAIGVFEPVETAEAYRRRGVGKALLQEGVRRLAERGVRWAKVSHNNDNPAAARLYASVGFTPLFERKVFTRW